MVVEGGGVEAGVPEVLVVQAAAVVVVVLEAPCCWNSRCATSTSKCRRGQVIPSTLEMRREDEHKVARRLSAMLMQRG